MRLTTVILIASLLQVSAATFGQRITLNKQNVPLKTVLKEIREQSGYSFYYDGDVLNDNLKTSVSLRNATLEQAIEGALEGLSLTYEIDNKIVLIKKKDPSFLDKVSGYYGNIDVAGRVLDETGQPIGGASVVVKSTGKGVSTAADGNFLLKNVEEGVTLIVKFIGYDAKEITAAKDVGVVRLKMATNELDAVQVQAYGTTSRRLSTSNITTVRAEDIEKQPVSNPLLALQGRVPGLVVTPVSGFAGGTVTVRIQGINSMRGGNNPFYVVDGVPYSSYMVLADPDNRMNRIWGQPQSVIQNAAQLSGESAGSPLNYINPSDIESIEVLKDADATAIYGSKAANGAIIITTKKGKAGPTKIDASIKSGFNKIGRSLEVLNYDEYRQMRVEARRNNNQAILASDYDLNGFWGSDAIDRSYQKSFLDKEVSNHNAQLSATGGSGAIDYRVSMGYRKVNGLFGNGLDNQSVSLGINLNTASHNRKFRLALSFTGGLDDNRLPYDSPIASLAQLAPNAPSLYNPDGSINWAIDPSNGFATWNNPMAALEQTTRSKVNNLNTSIALSYELFANLKLKSTFGYNAMTMENLNKKPITSFQPINQMPDFREAFLSRNNTNGYIVEPQLTYNGQIGGYRYDLLIGATVQRTDNSGNNFFAAGFPSDSQMDNLPIATYQGLDGFVSRVYRYNAGFARINLNKDDKFLLNFTARRDGSSRFGPANRFSNFAALGAGWVFTEHNYFKEKIPVLSFGKIKLSYGVTGNDQIGDYTYLDLYTPVTSNITYQGVSSIGNAGLYNSDLQWERNRKLNLGLEFGLFKDKIFFTGNYAINRSDNLLQTFLFPPSAKVGARGGSPVYVNFPGLVENRSLELTLVSKNLQRDHFSWQTSYNLTHTKNELMSLGDLSKLFGTATTYNVGQSLLARRLIGFYGVDPLTGTTIVPDRNGNPTVPFVGSHDDYTSFVDLLPSYTGGMSNTISYRGLSLDVFIQMQKQNMQRYLPATNYGMEKVNAPRMVLDRWRNPGDVTGVAKAGVSTNNEQTVVAYEDGSFIRLKNVALSWNLSDRILSSWKIRQLHIIAQVQNLWTLTRYSGLDPETGPSMLPLPRTIVFGFNIGL